MENKYGDKVSKDKGNGGGVQGKRCLSISNINRNVVKAQYAIRGELATRSEMYRQALTDGNKEVKEKLGFDKVVSANIGNPQQLGQKPLTFFRQVASLLEYPELLIHDKVLMENLGYKKDVIERAKRLLNDVGSVGAYSVCRGSHIVRESVAKFIERRDKFPANVKNIFLTNGASAAVHVTFNLICANSNIGVLIPFPQYPLYSATLTLLNAHAVPYYLEESSGWSVNVSDIQRSLEEARKSGVEVRCLVVINPGNPTGSNLSEDNIRDIIELAARETLVIVADEVYQENIFQGVFTSFKRVLRLLQQEEGESGSRYKFIELISLHSISKGMIGECGHRGGYMEVVGLDEKVEEQLVKLLTIQLCSSVIGQCLVELMVNPPREGDESYPLYIKEYNEIKQDLHDKATALYTLFKQLPGIECQSPAGAMYLFPSLNLPLKAIEAAEKEGRVPDEFYCIKLLDGTGICVVPGSGFGQLNGTQHFRTTFLASGMEWIERLKNFHTQFWQTYT